ncbi:MAG: hypothetical protein KDD48_09050 [Bdellovibrionales bacterium]|nr:hypothetical protein [Bdellovibrionales bacterium]
MRVRFGTKSVSAVALLYVTILIGIQKDVLRYGYISNLNSQVAYFLSAFAVLLGVGVYRFLRLHTPSAHEVIYAENHHDIGHDETLLLNYKSHFITIGKNPSKETKEIKPHVQRFIYMLIFFIVGLISIPNRSFNFIKEFPKRMNLAGQRYCPEKGEVNFDEPEKAGCRLLMRAYELGYTKDLGSCQPKEKEFEDKVCMLRRKDEPYLHYMWRLLAQFSDDVQTEASAKTYEVALDKFDAKTKNIEILYENLQQTIMGFPRASHHIWTNLPHPEHWMFAKYHHIFSPDRCIEKYQKMPNSIYVDPDDPRGVSKVLDHATGQLLFSSRVKDTVGFCKEFTIHWNSPADSCERLAKDPIRFLKEQSALPQVETVLRRYQIGRELTKLNTLLKEMDDGRSQEKDSENKEHDKEIRHKHMPTEFVSFHCFMETAKDQYPTKTHVVTLNGTDFVAKELRFPKYPGSATMQLSLYRNLSNLLSDGFHYDKFLSKSGVTLDFDSTERMASLSESDFRLTRLELLKNTDIFLGHEWIREREDLLEVYPFYLHLKHFVEVFRKEYKKKRSRL